MGNVYSNVKKGIEITFKKEADVVRLDGDDETTEKYIDNYACDHDADMERTENDDDDDKDYLLPEYESAGPKYSSELHHSFREFGLEIIEMEGDGNCLFRALSHQLHDNDSNHEVIRQKCADKLETRRDDFKVFIEGERGQDFDAYIGNMRRTGGGVEIYGGELEIFASHLIYSRPFEIWEQDPGEDGSNKLRVLKLYFDLVPAGSEPIRLFHSGRPNPNHYESLLLIKNAEIAGNSPSISVVSSRRSSIAQSDNLESKVNGDMDPDDAFQLALLESLKVLELRRKSTSESTKSADKSTKPHDAKTSSSDVKTSPDGSRRGEMKLSRKRSLNSSDEKSRKDKTGLQHKKKNAKS